MGILHVTNLEGDMFHPLMSALQEIGPIKRYHEFDGGDLDIEFEDEDHLQKALDQADELSDKIHADMPDWVTGRFPLNLSINEER